MLRSLAVAFAITLAACATTKQPELRVIQTSQHEVVFVQVTNTAKRPMRLSKLEYSFNEGKSMVSEGELQLFAREIPAGSMAVVEVPLDREPGGPMTLQGKLTAELDQSVRTYQVTAEILPSADRTE